MTFQRAAGHPQSNTYMLLYLQDKYDAYMLCFCDTSLHPPASCASQNDTVGGPCRFIGCYRSTTPTKISLAIFVINCPLSRENSDEDPGTNKSIEGFHPSTSIFYLRLSLYLRPSTCLRLIQSDPIRSDEERTNR